MGKLILKRKPMERVIITVGDIEIIVSVESIDRDGHPRLGFQAPPDVKINREEVQRILDRPRTK